MIDRLHVAFRFVLEWFVSYREQWQIFENFDCRTRITYIVIDMQYLQCAFYSLLSIQSIGYV